MAALGTGTAECLMDGATGSYKVHASGEQCTLLLLLPCCCFCCGCSSGWILGCNSHASFVTAVV